ncbi:MAG: hypothetical protein APF84_19790 [Gracilibacter sp. BRH_c7a]|nr:MAG: hypothetical protein APF84_19790 [Gracilibacter sp. BRH_c7a]
MLLSRHNRRLTSPKRTCTLFILSLFTLLALVFPANILAITDNYETERLAGSNRMETMYQIALHQYPGMVDNVVLASGYGFADALAGVPFAHQKNAPILLVNQMPKADSQAIKYITDHLRIDGKAYILGGDGVISPEYEKALTALGIPAENIIRIAGANRYETAVEIAKNMVHDGSEYYLVSGVDFPDALSASVLAATTNYYSAEEVNYLASKGKSIEVSRGGVPIILLPSNGTIPDIIVKYLNNSLLDITQKQTLQVIGGTGAISEELTQELNTKVTYLSSEGVKRISGSDRYHTNKSLVLQQDRFNKSWQNNGRGLPVPQLVLASGQDYPDALSGAVLAANIKAPLVLINENLPTATSDILLNYYQRNLSAQATPSNIIVLGGTGVVSQETVTKVHYIFNYGKIPVGKQVSTLATDFNFPFAAVQAANGNIYVSDTKNHLIKVVEADGSVATFAGNIDKTDDYGMPVGGLVDGQREKARFNLPSGLALDNKGNLFIADSGNGAIRVIDNNGLASTLIKDLSLPSDIILSTKGTLYVTETLKHRVLEVKMDGTYEVIAGGNYEQKDGYLEGAFTDGRGEEAKFNEPIGLTLGADGIIYVTDSGNQRIRMITPDKQVSTLAGSGTEFTPYTTYIKGGFNDGILQTAEFNFPTGITIGPDGSIYVADSYNHAIRVISGGQVTTLTGKGIYGKNDGYLEQALFDGPSYLEFLSNGNLLVIDQLNNQLRVIDFQ